MEIGVDLNEKVARVANLLGLLLALDTLFTAEQGRRLAQERRREGGADRAALRLIRVLALGLAVVTTTAVAVLFPLFRDVLKVIGEPEWEPVLGVFELTWILLVALAMWQVVIAWQSRPRI